jgi:hypothetical protein
MSRNPPPDKFSKQLFAPCKKNRQIILQDGKFDLDDAAPRKIEFFAASNKFAGQL